MKTIEKSYNENLAGCKMTQKFASVAIFKKDFCALLKYKRLCSPARNIRNISSAQIMPSNIIKILSSDPKGIQLGLKNFVP